MLRLDHFSDRTSPTAGVLVLPFDVRRKSRFFAELEDGRKVIVTLPRGSTLRGGDVIDGPEIRVAVRAAREQVSVARTQDPVLLLRAAYHLGNRHVPLQIGVDRLVYQHDHVLDRMVTALGLSVSAAELAFEPESGAFSGGHHHADDHDSDEP
jgi:urease accessory protein